MNNQANFSNFLVLVCAGLIIFFLSVILYQASIISDKIDRHTEAMGERAGHTTKEIDGAIIHRE